MIFTRQIFYYQLRNDILDGKLTVPQNKINSLVPHMLQFENGNYKPGDSLNVLSSLKFGDTTLTEDDMHRYGFILSYIICNPGVKAQRRRRRECIPIFIHRHKLKLLLECDTFNGHWQIAKTKLNLISQNIHIYTYI